MKRRQTAKVQKIQINKVQINKTKIEVNKTKNTCDTVFRGNRLILFRGNRWVWDKMTSERNWRHEAASWDLIGCTINTQNLLSFYGNNLFATDVCFLNECTGQAENVFTCHHGHQSLTLCRVSFSNSLIGWGYQKLSWATWFEQLVVQFGYQPIVQIRGIKFALAIKITSHGHYLTQECIQVGCVPAAH